MKYVLMLATTAAMIEQFNKNNILILNDMGYTIHVAGNFEDGNPISEERIEKFVKWIRERGGEVYHIPAIRNPLEWKKNYKAYKILNELVNEYSYSFIHCHTPIGGVLGRLIAHKTKTKVLYTAHGFHFFRGAPLKNWVMFFPVEWFLSKWTDVLILINHEDFCRAKKMFRAKRVEYIPGVGIDIEEHECGDKVKKEYREKWNIPIEATVILSVGEVNENKNHEVIIEAISKLKDQNLFYVVAGKGKLIEKLQHKAKKLGVGEKVLFTGFCESVDELYSCADIFAFPSKREGLGLAALEAMSFGLPLLTSNIHGINDYSEDGKSGFTCAPSDIDGYVQGIEKLMDKELRIGMGKYNKIKMQRFSIHIVEETMRSIYSDVGNCSLDNGR